MAGFSGGSVTNNTPADTTAPAFASAAVNGAALTVTFNENLKAGEAPPGSTFTVSGGRIGTAIGTGTTAISGATVSVTLDAYVTHGETVTVSYTQGPSSVGRLQDAAGNLVANFSGKSVTNNTPQPPPSPQTSAKLVGNTSVGGTFDSYTASTDIAQAFTTGSNAAGYKLTRADLRMKGGSGTAPTYSVSIHADSSGEPAAASLGTLTNPASWPATLGAARHDAPDGGITLESGTTYWLVFDISANSSTSTDDWLRRATDSDDEDADPAAGWSIRDGLRWRITTSTSWGSGTTDDSLLVDIHGYALSELVTNTGQSAGSVGLALRIDYAQAFTTGGGTGGYKLTGASLRMQAGTGTVPQYMVSIHEDSSDFPGTRLGTLTNPASLPSAAGLVEFKAPGRGIDLVASTKYWLVLDVTADASQSFRFFEIPEDDEDAGSKPGWSIADGSRWRNSTSGTWDSTDTTSLILSIAGAPADNVAPAFESAAVNGTALSVTFDKDLDTGSVPDSSNFTVSGGGGRSGTGTATISGKTVSVTLDAAVTNGETVTVSYAQPSSGSKLQDAVGNLVAGFTAQAVTNNTPGTTPPPATPVVSIASNGNITAGSAARFTVTASTAPASNLTVNLNVTQTGGVLTNPGAATVIIQASTTSTTVSTVATTPGTSGTVTIAVQSGSGYTVSPTASSATVNVSASGSDPAAPADPADPGGSETSRPAPLPLQLALWTDQPGYRAGETVRLYRTLDPHDDKGRYRTFVYLERPGGGERRYLDALRAEGELQADAVDGHGLREEVAAARILVRADRVLSWEGEAPGPGLWQFVLELRPGEPSEQFEEPDEPYGTRRAWARFSVAERTQLLNRRGFDREVRDELTLRGDTVYYMLHQLFVRDGATLTIEPGTLVRAAGRHAAIIVEPGGRIVAEGTREAPVVLTCSAPAGQRQPGCWGGLRILGRAPVTRLEGVAPGVLPAERAVYGGADAEGSSGALRYVRVEFAGAGGDPGEPEAGLPAIGLYGAGSGTVLDHVQAHASLGDGFAFRGGSAVCGHCVASSSGGAGLSWERGWRGGASHLYVQHGRGSLHGLVGDNDEQGHDREPRSRPVLSNVTLVHAAPYGGRERGAVGLQLSTGSAVTVRDLLASGFGGGAVKAHGRSALLFGEGESSVSGALLHRNGGRPLRGVLGEAVEYISRDPKLRDVRDFPNPDPRPKPDSPALRELPPDDREIAPGWNYIGAFGRQENWLEKWTAFGPESAYDLALRDEEGN